MTRKMPKNIDLKIVEVKMIADYKVLVTFEHGEKRTLDLVNYIKTLPNSKEILNDKDALKHFKFSYHAVFWLGGDFIIPEMEFWYEGTPA